MTPVTGALTKEGMLGATGNYSTGEGHNFHNVNEDFGVTMYLLSSLNLETTRGDCCIPCNP